MHTTFGGVIGDVRQEKGWSVYALARRAGLTDQAIHDLEGSDRVPTFDTAAGWQRRSASAWTGSRGSFRPSSYPSESRRGRAAARGRHQPRRRWPRPRSGAANRRGSDGWAESPEKRTRDPNRCDSLVAVGGLAFVGVAVAVVMLWGRRLEDE